MSDIVVCKFGGSSLANAGQIRKVKNIVQSNPRRKIVVVSAPGRQHSSEEKITDHLINVATSGRHFREQRVNISAEKSKEAVISRFAEIIEELELEAD